MKPSSVKTRSLLAFSSLAAALVAGGCGDGRNYQAGLTDQAALDEAAYKEQETSKPQSAKKSSAAQAAPAPSVDVPAAPGASGDGAAGSAIAEATGNQDAGADAAPGTELFEPDGFTPSTTGRRLVNSVAAELSLPAPAPVAEAPGEEPYQKHARDRRFDEFRRKSARYVQLKKQLLPLGRKLADGTATPAERALHNRLEDAIAVEFKPLNRYLWDERWTEADRAAMGWILFVKPD